jgi:periplasmic mercuric ion binding protein
MKKLFVLLFISFLPLLSNAQKKVEKTIKVSAVCGMCKERIEKALDIEGVVFSEYTVESQELFVVYKPKKIEWSTIEKLVLEAGHDVEEKKASDKCYDALDACCKYRSQEVIDAHK